MSSEPENSLSVKLRMFLGGFALIKRAKCQRSSAARIAASYSVSAKDICPKDPQEISESSATIPMHASMVIVIPSSRAKSATPHFSLLRHNRGFKRDATCTVLLECSPNDQLTCSVIIERFNSATNRHGMDPELEPAEMTIRRKRESHLNGFRSDESS